MRTLRQLFKVLTVMAAGSALWACQANDQDAEVIAAAKAGYDAFAANDMEAWAATQASDVQWEMPKGFPYGGHFEGAQAVIDDVFTPIAALWPDFKVEPVAYHASGNVVFIETLMTAGGEQSDSIHRAVIENGKYVEFQVYDDTGFMLASALKPNEEMVVDE